MTENPDRPVPPDEPTRRLEPPSTGGDAGGHPAVDPGAGGRPGAAPPGAWMGGPQPVSGPRGRWRGDWRDRLRGGNGRVLLAALIGLVAGLILGAGTVAFAYQASGCDVHHGPYMRPHMRPWQQPGGGVPLRPVPGYPYGPGFGPYGPYPAPSPSR